MSAQHDSPPPGAGSVDQELEPPRAPPTQGQLLTRIWVDWLAFLMTGR